MLPSSNSKGECNCSGNNKDVNFQDFLTPPLNFTIAIDPPTTSTVSSSPSNTSSSLHSPLTALSLSSHHFEPLSHKDLQLAQPHASKVDPLCNPFQSQLVHDSCDSLSSFGNKRFLESDDGNSRDRRTKRMMKNRESAARSRARKQENIAYTFELQQKIELLLAENARLRTQHQRLLCDAAANQQQNKKGSLYRTSTAPF
ncbi:Basic-leucine zipper domain [Sesbania bispinosa]|nr:Basic-leucine zipper domain [Sesbania bispinosa]